MPTTITVYNVNPATHTEKTKLAEFVLEGDEVKATYTDKVFERTIEDEGVYTPEGILRPSDGPKFLEALDRAFHRSSTVLVVRTEAD